MTSTARVFRGVYRVSFVVLLLTASVACFNPRVFNICDLDSITLPPATVTSRGSAPVLEDPGVLQVIHGGTCALSGDFKDFTKLEDSVVLPAYATRATVLLNGWSVGYTNGDHHVHTIAVGLGKIRLEPGRLTWSAVGSLLENGSDEPYSFCYRYTVIAWNDAQLQATVDHGDPRALCLDNFFITKNDGTTTALSCFATFLQNPAFASSKSVAVLPRGFLFNWDTDHHLLQLGYNLDHSEVFIAAQKYKRRHTEVTPLHTPDGRADAGFVSWNTYALFKDNEGRRDYRFGELISAVGGSDVGVLQPPFAILPVDSSLFGAHLGSGGGIKHQRVVIDNIPFAYAIPVLTGWELAYGRSDRHVKLAGIWIDRFSYEWHPGLATGTLRYTVTTDLEDDGLADYSARHKVTILGFRPLAGAGAAGRK